MICPICQGKDNPTYKGRKVCKDCYRKQKKARRTKNWARLSGYKTHRPCMDCDTCHPPYVMQFDHRPDEEKKAAVSDLVGLEVKWETILKEIAKCDLVCSNCHAIRTHTRKSP